MKTPYTENTKEARVFLESQGFDPLSFFQGKKYVYPIISTFANYRANWKVKDYSTFDEVGTKTFLVDFPLSIYDFKEAVINFAEKE